jgi:hypothetical protein
MSKPDKGRSVSIVFGTEGVWCVADTLWAHGPRYVERVDEGLCECGDSSKSKFARM